MYQQHQTIYRADGTDEARSILDRTWKTFSQTPFVAHELGMTQNRLPDVGLEAVADRASVGREVISELERLDFGVLPDDLAVDLGVARRLAEDWIRAEDWHWLVFDPLGGGFFSMFAPSAYSGAFVLGLVNEGLASEGDSDAANRGRDVEMVGDYARLIRQFTERTRGQADRGIRMPVPQLVGAAPLVENLRGAAQSTLMSLARRVAGTGGGDHAQRIEDRVEAEVLPAFDELLNLLTDADYVSRAPEEVGLSNYPGGSEVYEELVAIHTTQKLSAEEVHTRGVERMARIAEDMSDLLDEQGFVGSPQDYLAELGTSSRWRADTEEGIAEHFQRSIDRFDEVASQYFPVLPSARHGVAALPAALSDSMTFGYYSPPEPDREAGLYFYNAANLSRTALPMIASLTYHELVPGHHLHLALQQQRSNLHPIRQHSAATAFTEGWAEYAAAFAGEVGMYSEPEERFGRLMMEAFLTSRLVVDTGLNIFGWTLEEGRAYMRERSFMGEVEIASETLRYSCDIPGQALAYALGDEFLHELRGEVEDTLGERYTVSGFHEAVLDAAGLPLPLVAQQVRSRMR